MKQVVKIAMIGGVLGSLFLASAHAQEAGTSRTGKKPPLKVRVLALGHPRPITYRKTTEEEVVVTTLSNGKTLKEVIPAGTLDQYLGSYFEYMPSPLQIIERSRMGKKTYKSYSTSVNVCSPEQTLSPRSRLNFLLEERGAPPRPEMEKRMLPYVSVPVPEGKTQLLVTLVNSFKEKEGWKKPLIYTFDTSPKTVPRGSLFLFNGAPFNIELHLSATSKDKPKKMVLKPYEHRSFKPLSLSNGRVLVKALLVSKSGSKKQFFYSSVRMKETGRSYLFTYFIPTKNAPNPAGMVQFYDEAKTATALR